MTPLAETYRSFVGQRLAALAWRPITCDTRGTVLDLGKPVIEFSGAASLFFDEGREILLTWTSGVDGGCHLAAAELSAWRPFSLDLVHASPEDPWTQFAGARLEQVSLFRDSIAPAGSLLSDTCSIQAQPDRIYGLASGKTKECKRAMIW